MQWKAEKGSLMYSMEPKQKDSKNKPKKTGSHKRSGPSLVDADRVLREIDSQQDGKCQIHVHLETDH